MIGRLAGIACVISACGFRPSSIVAGDAATDDSIIDAPVHDAKIFDDAHPTPFDPAQCPNGYTSIGGSGTSSHYRAAAAGVAVSWDAAESACEADKTATGPATHLVVFDSTTEHDAVIAAIAPSINDNYMWTGNYTISGATWLAVTGGTMTDRAWAPTEPVYKTDGYPANNPNGAALEGLDVADGTYVAEPFNYDYDYVCECDGKPVGMLP